MLVTRMDADRGIEGRTGSSILLTTKHTKHTKGEQTNAPTDRSAEAEVKPQVVGFGDRTQALSFVLLRGEAGFSVTVDAIAGTGFKNSGLYSTCGECPIVRCYSFNLFHL